MLNENQGDAGCRTELNLCPAGCPHHSISLVTSRARGLSVPARAQIDLNVWAHTVLLLLAPQWADPPHAAAPLSHQRASAVAWLTASLLGAAWCTLIAWAVPFFSTVMGLIAAVGDMSAAFILPALFCLRLVRPAMRRWEVWCCWGLLPVAVALAVLGTWSSGLQLLLQLRHRKAL